MTLLFSSIKDLISFPTLRGAKAAFLLVTLGMAHYVLFLCLPFSNTIHPSQDQLVLRYQGPQGRFLKWASLTMRRFAGGFTDSEGNL